MFQKTITFLVLFSVVAGLSASAQTPDDDQLGRSDNLDSNPIITAVPFLLISPDSRSSAMGDAGAAISADANATHWNMGKLVFADHDYGVSLSYNPWLRSLVDDMSLAYLSGYFKLDEEQAVGVSLRYFDLGNIFFTDLQGNSLGDYNPTEWSVSAGYSRKLSDKIGLGVNARFIRSNLGEQFTQNSGGASIPTLQPANGLAVDLGFYSRSETRWFSREGEFAWAVVLSNIGNKISYLDESTENFIPGNLKLGTAYTVELDPFNKLTLALDANKLLVPTPDDDPDASEPSLLEGTFTSFADAPGGFSEELKEISLSTGLEYWYNDLFAARAGYFWEHEDKGNRKYFTMGVGLRYQLLNLDFAYLIPQDQTSPLAETLRITIGVNFDRNSEVDRSIRQ
jgi:hypothetical protein